jgi:hypothetical protein
VWMEGQGGAAWPAYRPGVGSAILRAIGNDLRKLTQVHDKRRMP